MSYERLVRKQFHKNRTVKLFVFVQFTILNQPVYKIRKRLYYFFVNGYFHSKNRAHVYMISTR